MKRPITLTLVLAVVALRVTAQDPTPTPPPRPLKVLDASVPEFTWVPQDSAVPGLDQYAVVVCNKSGALMKVTASDVMTRSFQAGISMTTYTSLQRAIDTANRRSVWHRLGITGEILGWGTTIPVSGDLIKIEEKWVKAVVPIVSSALTLARTLLDRERRDVAEPADLFPAAGAALDPAACGTWAMFGEAK